MVITIMVIAGAALRADAGWSPEGVPVCQSGCLGYAHSLARDAAGGAYVGWVGYGAASDDDIYLQRLTASGEISAGWPIEGLPVCVQPDVQTLNGVSEDGQGGVLLVWIDRRDASAARNDVYAQRVLADGSIAPGWLPNGTPVNADPKSADFARVAPDGAGGAYFVWEDYRDFGSNRPMLYAQHLLGDGSVAPGWPINGRLVNADSSAIASHTLLADGQGGFFTTWSTVIATFPGETRALRFTAAGTLAPGWPASGVHVFNDVASYWLDPDAEGGAFVSGVSFNRLTYADQNYRVQRLTRDGAISTGWSPEGLLVRTSTESAYGLYTSSDAAGGVLMAWYDYRGPGSHIYASRVLASGVLAPGWTPNGTLVSDPTNPNEFSPVLTPDLAGGMYLMWEAYVGSQSPGMIKHVTATGGTAPGWPAAGQRILPSGSQTHLRLISDDVGGAIVSWPELDPPITRYGVFLQRYAPNGIVAVQLSLASVVANPNSVALVWSGVGAGALEAHIERRNDGTEWETLGLAQADGPDRLRFQDASVTPGARYAYRLGYDEDGAMSFTTEEWVDVPLAFEFALEGFWPNPATGPLSVSFSLPSAAHANLELIDVSGRRVAQRDLVGLGAGRHFVRIAEAGVRPGVYWIRLQQGERTLLKRGVVTR